MDADKFEQVEIKSDGELWYWLAANHQQSKSVWFVTWKVAEKSLYVSRDQVLDALIAFGWIDGRRMKRDEATTMQLVSPRKQQAWASTYKQRAERLIKDGRMQEAGLAAIELSKKLGKWDELAHVDVLVEPVDLKSKLKDAGAYGWWQSAAPSYKRNIIRWLATAKKEETLNKRIEKIVDYASRGEKVPNY